MSEEPEDLPPQYPDPSAGLTRWLWPALGLSTVAVFAALVLLVESEPAFVDVDRKITSLPAAYLDGPSLDSLIEAPLVVVLVWMPG